MPDPTYYTRNNASPKGLGVLPSHPQHHRKRRQGLHVRLRREPGITPKDVLDQPLRFPVVTGQEFTVEEEFGWEEFQSVGAGDFLVPRSGEHAPSLRKWSNEVMTLTWNPRWLARPHVDPAKLIKRLRWIGRHRAPFHMLILQRPNYGMKADYSGLAVLLSLSVITRRGEPDTRYLQMDFSQYRPMTVRRRGRSRLPTTHRLTKDDTLRSLAKKYYGSQKHWRAIKRANGIHKWGGANELVKMKRYKRGDWIKIPVEPEVHIGTSVTATGGRRQHLRSDEGGIAEVEG